MHYYNLNHNGLITWVVSDLSPLITNVNAWLASYTGIEVLTHKL